MDSELGRAPLEQWPVQHFRAKPITVLLLLERGNVTRGIVYRNLLTLGWMIPPDELAPPRRNSRLTVAVVASILGVLVIAIVRGKVPSSARREERRGRQMPRKKAECSGFRSFGICLRCRHYELRGGRDYCSKFRRSLPRQSQSLVRQKS